MFLVASAFLYEANPHKGVMAWYGELGRLSSPSPILLASPVEINGRQNVLLSCSKPARQESLRSATHEQGA
jgi:hypothetical protein